MTQILFFLFFFTDLVFSSESRSCSSVLLVIYSCALDGAGSAAAAALADLVYITRVSGRQLELKSSS